jgi:hypothetical protein
MYVPQQPQPAKAKQHSSSGTYVAQEDTRLPPGMVGALVGGSQSRRQQRPRRLPPKLMESQQWDNPHQQPPGQQQGQGSPPQAGSSRPTRPRNGAAKARGRPRKHAKGGSAAAAAPGTAAATAAGGAATEQQPGGEGFAALPANFRESGQWLDDEEEEEEDGQQQYSEHSESGGDSVELGATQNRYNDVFEGTGGL